MNSYSRNLSKELFGNSKFYVCYKDDTHTYKDVRLMKKFKSCINLIDKILFEEFRTRFIRMGSSNSFDYLFRNISIIEYDLDEQSTNKTPLCDLFELKELFVIYYFACLVEKSKPKRKVSVFYNIVDFKSDIASLYKKLVERNYNISDMNNLLYVNNLDFNTKSNMNIPVKNCIKKNNLIYFFTESDFMKASMFNDSIVLELGKMFNKIDDIIKRGNYHEIDDLLHNLFY